MNILCKKNSNQLYQDSLIAAIHHLSQKHKVGLYDNNASFFDLYNKFKPDLIIIDSKNISPIEAKCLSNSKLPIVDWNKISDNKLYIDIKTFKPQQPIDSLRTQFLGYIRYSSLEKELLKKYISIENLAPTKIFSHTRFVSHVHCGNINFEQLNLFINSAETILSTNSMLTLICEYLNKSYIDLIGYKPTLSIENYLPHTIEKDLEDVEKCQFIAENN